MLKFTINKHLQRTHNTSFNPRPNVLEYKDKISGRRYPYGLTKLKLVFVMIKPQLVVDHVIKEQDLQALSLVRYGNTIHTYLTSLQYKRNEINMDLLGNKKYPSRRFNTPLLAQMEKSTCKYFLTKMKSNKSYWIRLPEIFNLANDIGDLVKLYTNFASNGTWIRAHDRHTQDS